MHCIALHSRLSPQPLLSHHQQLNCWQAGAIVKRRWTAHLADPVGNLMSCCLSLAAACCSKSCLERARAAAKAAASESRLCCSWYCCSRSLSARTTRHPCQRLHSRKTASSHCHTEQQEEVIKSLTYHMRQYVVGNSAGHVMTLLPF